MTTASRNKSKSTSATIASMAAKPADAPAQTPAEAPAQTPAETPSATVAIDWASFPAAEIAVYTRNSAATVDREATTPEFIKAQVKAAFAATEAAGNPKSPVWLVIPFGSAAVEEEFLKVGKRYASFLGYTMRGVPNTKNVGEARFCVKPKEHRAKNKPAAGVVAA